MCPYMLSNPLRLYSSQELQPQVKPPPLSPRLLWQLSLHITPLLYFSSYQFPDLFAAQAIPLKANLVIASLSYVKPLKGSPLSSW